MLREDFVEQPTVGFRPHVDSEHPGERRSNVLGAGRLFEAALWDSLPEKHDGDVTVVVVGAAVARAALRAVDME